MAGAGRSWIRPVVLAVGLVGAGAAAGAQTAASVAGPPNAAAGSIAGRLTDLHSAPLNGATVVVRNAATGAEARGTTKRNGSFRFTGLEPGEYTVEAEKEPLGRGRLQGVVVSAGAEAHVQAAMAFEPSAGLPVEVAANSPAPAISSAGGAVRPSLVAIPVLVPAQVVQSQLVAAVSSASIAMANRPLRTVETAPPPADPLREFAIALQRADSAREPPLKRWWWSNLWLRRR